MESPNAGRRGNRVVLPPDFLVVPAHVRRPASTPPVVKAVPVVFATTPPELAEETKEAPQQEPRTLPLSTETKVLAVREGAKFRAKLRRSKTGLGVTVKSTSDGRIVVHALPRSGEERGRAECAGVKVGDEVLGVGDEYFPTKTSLASLVEHIKNDDKEVIVLILKRGTGKRKSQQRYHKRLRHHSTWGDSPPQEKKSNELTDVRRRRHTTSQFFSPTHSNHYSLPAPHASKMAALLKSQGVIDDLQASVLSSMMARLERRLERWDRRGDLLAGSPHLLAFSTTKVDDNSDDDERDYFSDDDDDGTQPETTEEQQPTRVRRAASAGALPAVTASSVPQQNGKPTTKARMMIQRARTSDAKSSPREQGDKPRGERHPLLRPALCVRILGTDYVEDHTVYILWVLDVLAGAEWRVQRRFREFFELHEDLVKLRPSIEKLDFPMRRPTIYETVHSVNDRRVRLEKYLRRVSGALFSSRLHARSSDVADRLQTFLDVPKRRASLELLERNPDVTLRQACQVATAQLLSLPVFEKILSDVVSSTRDYDFETGAAMLSKMKQYIDHLQQAILDGARDSVLKNVVLRRIPSAAMPEDDLINIASAAVRRQIETDVFVPLMDKLHSLLASDIAEDERALRSKCHRARSRPQTFYGIPLHHISPSSWESAIYQLANIGAYTLPCDKLDALLSAAKEIPALYLVEHPGTDLHLGADSFLPIFIYVLINANIPNLLHLQRILCALCDPEKRLSETGYYVATFEAAVTHIRELDLG